MTLRGGKPPREARAEGTLETPVWMIDADDPIQSSLIWPEPPMHVSACWKLPLS